MIIQWDYDPSAVELAASELQRLQEACEGAIGEHELSPLHGDFGPCIYVDRSQVAGWLVDVYGISGDGSGPRKRQIAVGCGRTVSNAFHALMNGLRLRGPLS